MEQQAQVRQRRVPPATLGPMLAAARLRAGLRGRECARLAGVDAGYLVRLESGQRVPSRTVAEILAEVLQLDQAERGQLFAVAVDDAGRGYWRGRRTA
jgi:transcriptional regulator with XRE-family HTH domain